MKKFAKIMCLILALSMLFGCMAGCTSTAKTEQPAE